MGEGGTRELHRALSRAVENRTKYKTRSRQRRSSSVVFSLILYKKVSKVGIPKVGRKVLEVSLRDFTNTTHPILGLRIFEGSHLPIKIRTMDPEYNRWQGIPAVLQYSPLLPGLCVVIHLLAGFLEQSGL